MCEFWAIGKGEKPNGKIYEEHKLILELLDSESILDKIRAEIVTKSFPKDNMFSKSVWLKDVLKILDKYKAESEDKE